MESKSLSKYEFVQQLRHAPEVECEMPDYLRGLTSTSDMTAADEKVASRAKNLDPVDTRLASLHLPRFWLIRRRRDDKVRN